MVSTALIIIIIKIFVTSIIEAVDTQNKSDMEHDEGELRLNIPKKQ